MLQLQPSVLKANLASVNVLQHTDENFYMTCDRDFVKSLEAHSPFSPQISGSHPSLILNTGHHQSDSQDHLWVRLLLDPSDSCLPIPKAQDCRPTEQALLMARAFHQLLKHALGHTPISINSENYWKQAWSREHGRGGIGLNSLSSHSPDSNKLSLHD